MLSQIGSAVLTLRNTNIETDKPNISIIYIDANISIIFRDAKQSII